MLLLVLAGESFRISVPQRPAAVKYISGRDCKPRQRWSIWVRLGNRMKNILYYVPVWTIAYHVEMLLRDHDQPIKHGASKLPKITFYSLGRHPHVVPKALTYALLFPIIKQSNIYWQTLSTHLCPCPGQMFPLPPPTGLLFIPDPALGRCWLGCEDG